MSLCILQGNGIKCDSIITDPPLLTSLGAPNLALRLFTSDLQSPVHLLLASGPDVSFWPRPFENERRRQRIGTSGFLVPLGACITGGVKKGRKE